MNEFDIKALIWDSNPMHKDRSVAIANEILKRLPLTKQMDALEYGAGTGITSFLLKDHLKKIVMMDSSEEMVRIMNEKITANKTENLEALFFNLEKDPCLTCRFDLIMTQMVLHHVEDIDFIIGKFREILNPGGYIAIADLYPEDGSFHGEGFTGHKGFDTDNLSEIIRNKGFGEILVSKCFTIRRKISESSVKEFDIFLLTAKLPAV